ncbi:hypothetical protein, conserved [Trypanosoma brucei gambiense DAL972]|uniref:Uncharacterized protein n=1 Tax=Trypanosoma brucei gambiense (strain MHOM/CI/86/DAL972) TaxID=679716 RepID=C9ZSX8_TRYB9|nr:hypothetical protein, conserved [Trypanosoma brucei gambiense DAL972]CBH12513.1 hypothetical protein, conserved [Trypanosoma brucei gambiense DAL972]|eukprot:XP_011774793.1 hypothetical protein, conserved [Trypanosoma brucei gambiense DAL972]
MPLWFICGLFSVYLVLEMTSPRHLLFCAKQGNIRRTWTFPPLCAPRYGYSRPVMMFFSLCRRWAGVLGLMGNEKPVEGRSVGVVGSAIPNYVGVEPPPFKRSVRALSAGPLTIHMQRRPYRVTPTPEEPYSLPARVRELTRSNQWQDAIHLIYTLTHLSSSEHCSEAQECSGKKTGVSDVFEMFLFEFLRSGHVESAFAVWRKCSTNLKFDPGSELLMKFATFSLVVDGKTQESLDLALMARQSQREGDAPGEHFVEYGMSWILLCTKLSGTAKIGASDVTEVQNLAEKLFVRCWCQPQQSSGGGVNQFKTRKLRFMLHGMVALVSLEGGLEVLRRLSTRYHGGASDSVFQEFVSLAEIFESDNHKNKAAHTLTAAPLPSMLIHLFPLPLPPSGLVVFRYLFCDDDDAPSRREPPQPRLLSHRTVGTTFLERLVENGSVDSFLRSAVEHDISESCPSLLTRVMQSQLGANARVLPTVFGRQLLPSVQRALRSRPAAGTLHLLLLRFLSRVLGPFLGTRAGKGSHMEFPAGGGSIASSAVFYIELLGCVAALVPTSGIRAWHRFVQRVTRAIIRECGSVSGAAIPSLLQVQLHTQWFLPELLTYVDTTRERDMYFACQHPLMQSRERNWDRILCALIWECHGKPVSAYEGTGSVSWHRHAGGLVRYAGEEDRIRAFEGAPPFFDVKRSFVQRVVRWQWLLESLWQLVGHKNGDRNHCSWEELLCACSGILSNCRKYHRGDIVRDFVDVLFLPAASFVSPRGSECCRRTNVLTLLSTCADSGCGTTESVTLARWYFLNELSLWFTTLHVSGRFRALGDVLQPGPDRTAQRFALLRNYVSSVSANISRSGEVCKNKRQQLQDLLTYYNEVCKSDNSLRTPQLLSPLASALRRADLLDSLEELIKVSLSELSGGLRGRSGTRAALKKLLFFHDFHRGSAVCAESGCTSHVTDENYHGAAVAVANIAEVYILMLLEHGHLETVEKILLRPPASHSLQDPATEVASPTHGGADGFLSPLQFDITLLMPSTNREAMQLLFFLYLAQEKNVSCWRVLDKLPKYGASAAGVVAVVGRLVSQEKHLFGQFSRTAIRLADGSLHPKTAGTIIYGSNRGCIQNKPQMVATVIGGKKRASNLKDLNHLINNGDWVLALRSIPFVLTDPLHITRKALLVCEAVPHGAAWEGAVRVFVRANHICTDISHGVHCMKEHTCSFPVMGIQEIGRLLTLLASARRWQESLQVFESVGSHAVDGYMFAETCFTLRSSGHPGLAVDLWAMWRAAVGDAVAPTPRMCGQFLACGVVGDVDVADAACVMVREATIPKYGTWSSAKPELPASDEKCSSSPCVVTIPGTELALSFEREEDTVATLLRDRWNGSWQDALQMALASGRSRIIQEVARKSPRNHSIYKAVVGWAAKEQRQLSVAERCAIAGHLITNPVSDGGEYDRVGRVLEELLGSEDD